MCFILQYLYFTVFIFYSIYILGLVLQWVKDEGGVDKMEENSRLKSQAVYDAIEKSNGFYQYVQYYYKYQVIDLESFFQREYIQMEKIILSPFLKF